MEKIKKKYSKTDCLILGIGFLILGLFVLSNCNSNRVCSACLFYGSYSFEIIGLSFHIKDWTLDAYRRVLENEMIWRGFRILFCIHLHLQLFLFL